MRVRNILKIVSMTAVTVVAFLVLRSASPAGENDNRKESIEQCSKKKESKGGEMIWENLSQQFFSTL